MADPWRWWAAADIARITGCPLEAVEASWPLIADALDRRGIYDRDVCLGVLPTIAIETAGTFEPIHEYGTPADWAGYGGGADYAGRGYIQLTHLANYRAAGDALGLALAVNPNLALDPHVAADILAWYWATKGVSSKDGTHWYSLKELCHEHDYEWVRRVVQGGTAGLDRLIAQASALDAYAAPPEEPAMPRVTFNLQEPPHLQEHDYDCSQDSLEWALWSLGRRPSDAWLEETMIAEGVLSKAVGLLDPSGAGLAAFIRRQYGEFGFDANHEPGVTFDALAAEAGPYPMLIGGRAWNHWSGLWGYDRGQGVLLLANPSPGWHGVQQAMNRQQFQALGPFSMVRVLHPDLLIAPPPDPTPPASLPTRADVAAIMAQLAALRDRLPA